ncbi:MAG: hypothetical protein LBC85_12555 [Fibromonadaceae bacterium]|jgi:hypothetical protein|nr:hypothetical protein [Fibromonadaceae bacterium]
MLRVKGISLAFFLLLLNTTAYSTDLPKIIFKEGTLFAGFDLQQGKPPCKENSPCLFFHKDSENLRLILNGKNIRMAYKGKDREPMPFPKNFRIMEAEEKAEMVKNYRNFFKSEFALMLQAFVYTSPEIFDWNVDKFKAVQNAYLISEQELGEIFTNGKKPEFYTIFKIKCAGGEIATFESDANGSFYMEIE